MAFWFKRKIALTGATGFIGSHVALDLRAHGADVIALVRGSSETGRLVSGGVLCVPVSLDDVASLAAALHGCDIVIHAAGAVGFDSNWDTYYRVNVAGTRNLVQAARCAGVRRIVHTSSIVAVGAAESAVSIDETMPWNLGQYRVPYVTTKRWAEDAALSADGSGVEVVAVNPASVVGPNDFGPSEFGSVCQRFWKGNLRFHFGGGNNYVDVRDVACGIRLAAERGRAGERYLLTGENRTYHAFFTELCRAADRTIARLRLPNGLASVIGYFSDRRKRKPSRSASFTSHQAALMGLYFFFDAAKARNELGYSARPLRESLADTFAFWTSHRKPAKSA